MDKKISILLLGMLLVIVAFAVNLLFPPNVSCFNFQGMEIGAKSAVVVDAGSGRVLFEKNKDDRLAMASTTKVMTAIVAIENTENLDEVFATDNRAVGIEGTSIYLKNDEHLSMRNLLLGLMLSSGNDASLAIAYRVGGTIEHFVELMNQKAQQLNLHNTHFDNPHGLDSQTHYTSAYDLAMITTYAMENPTFREIVGTKYATIPSSKNGEVRYLRNKHKLLQEGMAGCEGVKTGFTDNARRCCVTSCKRGKMRLVCVVLNCQDMFEESRNVLEHCFEEFKCENLLEANKCIDSICVQNGMQDSVRVYTKTPFYYPLKDGELEKINQKISLKDSLDAPVSSGEEVGEYKIYFNNDLIFVAKIYTMEDVEEKNYTQKIKDIVENWY